MIPATKPYLPEREKYADLLDGIWERNWITNHGPLVRHFEKRLSEYLGNEHVSFVSSGTIALQLMLKTLPEVGEIITTPFSYVATANAISWQGHTPVFADILPDKLTIDPIVAREKITPNTRAILATHIYGNACEIEELDAISKAFNIPVFYDGAHCFGSKYQNKSLLKYGNMSVLSTHATKLFHTVNGGVVISQNAEQKRQIDLFRNFGHDGLNQFEGIGINGKNSEFHAAIGLALLDDVERILTRRKAQSQYYYKNLSNSNFEFLNIKNKGEENGAYFPIICRSKETTETLIEEAKKAGIELRRYFNPALNTLPFLNPTSCPVAEDISERIVCLPLFHEISQDDQDKVLNLIMQFHG